MPDGGDARARMAATARALKHSYGALLAGDPDPAFRRPDVDRAFDALHARLHRDRAAPDERQLTLDLSRS